MSTKNYCPEHKYNPPENSGFLLCPQCEAAPTPGSVLRCVLFKCNNAEAVWMEVGDCHQTRNGFFTIKIDGLYCPECGGGYGGSKPPNAEVRQVR
jgi:hypothetical protein